MMRKWSILLLLSMGFSPLLPASEKRGMTVADLFRIRTAGSPSISAEGKWVVYALATPDLSTNRIITQLYRTAFSGGDTLQLTRGESSAWQPQWQPRGNLLAFITNRSGQNQIWLIQPFYGEAEQLTDLKTGVQEWQWSHDGTRIAFTAQDSLLKSEERKRNSGDDARVADADFQMTHLYVIDITTKQVQRLTAGDYTVTTPVWSADDRLIYFVKRPTPAADDAWQADILAVPADSGAVLPVATTAGTEVNPLPAPNGKWVAFTYSPGTGRWLGNAQLYLVSVAGGEPRCVSSAFDGSVYATCWSPESRFIYFSAKTGVSENLFRLEVETGDITNLSKNEDVLADFNFSADGSRVVFTLQKPDRPQEVYSSDLTNFAPRRLSYSNRWLEEIEFGKTTVVHWRSQDGKEIEGILVRPGNGAEKPLPTIVRIHGGPAGVYSRSFLANWDHYAHILAAQGYAVFLPNFRGSVGYGEEFQRADIRNWGEGDFQDIMTGVDSLIAWQVADPQKLAIAGWSYGGYLTFWAITQTHRFQAAAAGAGLTNLFSMYSENDIPSVLDSYFGAAPWDDPAEYQRASPLTYVKNVTTPLLIMQGEQDQRVPKFQSEQFYTALQQLGKKTKMMLFPRQGHGIVELHLQQQKIEAEINWFNRYLKRQPTPPTDKVLTVDDIVSIPSVESPQISPDGKTVLFVVSNQPPDSATTISHIYRVNLPASGNNQVPVPVQITDNDYSAWQPRWSPMDERFAFLSNQAGKPQIFVMNPYYGEPGKISNAKSGVNNFCWSPDGQKLAYTTTDTLTEEQERARQAGNDAQVWEVTEQKMHLWLVDVATGDTTRLTNGDFNVLEFSWSPDDKEIAYTCAGYRVAEELRKSTLWLLDVQTKSTRELPVGEIGLRNLQWSPDGSQLAAVARLGGETGVSIRKPDILIFDRNNWQKTNVTTVLPWDATSFVWLPDASGLLVIGDQGVRSQIYRLSLRNGSMTPVSDGDFVHSSLSLSKDGGRISFLRAAAGQLTEVFCSNLSVFSAIQQSNLSAALTGFDLAQTEAISWQSPDGTIIEGLLVKPPDYEPGLHYPLVTIPHGGPVGHYSWQFNTTAQLFAANGYLVLLPNVRGSSAYGKQFLRANIGDLGGGDFEDLLSGVDHLVAAGLADGKRLGIWGWSYGGYLAAWAITQTDRFKAAVVGAAVTDWFSVYGQDDIQYDVEEYFLGIPYQNPILATIRSPLTDVARIKTPTLILHGEKDFRDPIPQAQNFYLALKKQGVAAELVVYPREGHSIREYRHRRDLLQRSLVWFNRYLAPAADLGAGR